MKRHVMFNEVFSDKNNDKIGRYKWVRISLTKLLTARFPDLSPLFIQIFASKKAYLRGNLFQTIAH